MKFRKAGIELCGILAAAFAFWLIVQVFDQGFHPAAWNYGIWAWLNALSVAAMLELLGRLFARFTGIFRATK